MNICDSLFMRRREIKGHENTGFTVHILSSDTFVNLKDNADVWQHLPCEDC